MNTTANENTDLVHPHEVYALESKTDQGFLVPGDRVGDDPNKTERSGAHAPVHSIVIRVMARNPCSTLINGCHKSRGGSRNSSRGGGEFWAGIFQGGVRVQVRRNFHMLTSKKKHLRGG